MKIDFNRLDDLNARMTMVIEQADYQPKLDENFKKYSKKLNLKGFRAGKTPKTVLNKMYGKGILEETVMEMLNKSLFDYLDENKIGYFGSPIMTPETESLEFDVKNPADYTFTFEMGVKPVFDLNYALDTPIEIFVPAIDESKVDEEIIRYRRIFGESTEVENGAVEKHDNVMLVAQLLAPDGTLHTDEFPLAKDLDRETDPEKFSLIGLKKGDTLDINLEEFLGGSRADVITRTFGEGAADPSPDAPLLAKATIKSIHRPQADPLTGEQLSRFVGRDMADEDEFKKMLLDRENQELGGRKEDMKKLTVRRRLIESNPFGLPEEFLLKWINRQREGKIESGSRQARGLFRDTSWSLLLNTIAEDKKLELTEKDIQKQVTQWVIRNVDYRQTDIKKLMEQLYNDEYFMSTMRETALEDLVLNALLPMYTFNQTEVSETQFEKEYHDIHHVMFDHDHHDHGHSHEHSHEDHEHSHG